MTNDLLTDFFAYFDAGQRICNFYGSTEMMDVTCSVFASAADVARQLSSAGKVPIGWPVLNSAAFVLDEQMRPVSMGQIGELFIASRNLADGYLGGTAGKFISAKELVN